MSIARNSKFEYYLDTKRLWRWRLRVGGFITADSGEGYSTESNCRRAIRRMKYNVLLAKVREVDA